MMKYKTLFLAVVFLPSLLAASDSFLEWKDIIGREFQAKIVGADDRSVQLENDAGKTIDFPIADLQPSSRDQVAAWKAANQKKAMAEAAALEKESRKASVFDEILNGNLVKLDGSRLKRTSDATHPEKYYVFYYTASWCPPCRKFTPSLVDWYEKNKNENFELVLITSDRSEQAMEEYAEKNKMPWPQLEMKDSKRFKDKFDHGVRGIPSLIVCSLDGEQLGNYRSKLDDLSKLVR